ncbi:MAG TPA: hypothetical protein DGZ94_20815 [Serratia sp.]|jgi:hypothetical protein|nr:hypothetical protein [Serratia sp. (in: enterobacteria)]
MPWDYFKMNPNIIEFKPVFWVKILKKLRGVKSAWDEQLAMWLNERVTGSIRQVAQMTLSP